MPETRSYQPRLRLFVADTLAEGAEVTLAPGQSHWLVTVMRAREGAAVGLFNGREGEWTATLAAADRRAAIMRVGPRYRAQEPEPDLWLAFAPVRREAIDFIATKATEIGVSRLIPVITARTRSARVNTRRLRANAVEAAEQCERLSIPQVDEPVALDALLGGWPPGRALFVGDETGAGRPVAEVAGGLAGDAPRAVLTGPEGGFAPGELDLLRNLDFVTPIGLGPRILRADTAALAALVVLQAVAGDWRRMRER